MFKAKISVVGPCEVGKSVLSNFLGDQTDNSQGEYSPTVGVRILEFESVVDSTTIDVELWDCSGNQDYEGCWPVMAYQADGVIIVFDPTSRNQNPSIETFYDSFVADKGLKAKQCMIFACTRQDEAASVKSPIAGVPLVSVNLEKNPVEIQNSFQNLLRNVRDKLSDSRDRQELSIIA